MHVNTGDIEMTGSSSGGRPRVLLIGGSPAPASPETVREAAFGCDAVIAIDRGLEMALAAQVPCDLFCGDGDSVGPQAARMVFDAEASLDGDDKEDAAPRFERGEIPFAVERYNPHKDATDLLLALDAVRERWGSQVTVRVTCLAGGAPDHFMAVMGQLARWDARGESGAVACAEPSDSDGSRRGSSNACAAPSVEIFEDGFVGRILQAGEAWELSGCRNQRFSFVPLSLEAVLSETGMRWKLDHERVRLLGDLGISNVIDADRARIVCHEGTLAAWCFDGFFAGA